MRDLLPPQAHFNESLRQELEGAGFDQEHAALLVWHGLIRSGACVRGEWPFADDKPDEPPATLKAVGEKLFNHRYWGGLILDLYESYPRVQSADVISYIPEGPRDFARRLGRRTRKPVADLRRVPGGARHDFEVMTERDRELVTETEKILFAEDVLTSGSSVAAAARYIRFLRELQGIEPPEQIDALAVLLRGKLKDAYCPGIGKDNEGPHYLLQVGIPRVANLFEARFGITPSTEEELPPHLLLPSEPPTH